ncbi:hypothetical protein ACFVZ3_05165 [Kitasatospora purpeofusca]|uniref:hypothetical protein n=1 Tax=Kitasatospora purpeofusca TaxID=67352 RepID=UPI0036A6FA6D
MRKPAGLVNIRRVAGRSGWAPLHRAAGHNAPTEAVERLLAAGARRPLRSAGGDAPSTSPPASDTRPWCRFRTRCRKPVCGRWSTSRTP